MMYSRGIIHIDDIDVRDRRCLLRVDLNVPMKNGKILDDTRITKIKDQIIELTEVRGAKLTLLTHLGDRKQTVKPVADRLGELIGYDIPILTSHLEQNDHKVTILENLRSCPGEENNDIEYAKELAKYGDVYINDAFSCSHRKHASIDALPRLINEAFIGKNFVEEMETLDRLLLKPEGPLCVIIGGSKISTKMSALEKITGIADKLVLGGGILNTCHHAYGHNIGKSLYEEGMKHAVHSHINEKCHMVMPWDFVVAEELKPNTQNTNSHF